MKPGAEPVWQFMCFRGFQSEEENQSSLLMACCLKKGDICSQKVAWIEVSIKNKGRLLCG